MRLPFLPMLRKAASSTDMPWLLTAAGSWMAVGKHCASAIDKQLRITESDDTPTGARRFLNSLEQLLQNRLICETLSHLGNKRSQHLSARTCSQTFIGKATDAQIICEVECQPQHPFSDVELLGQRSVQRSQLFWIEAVLNESRTLERPEHIVINFIPSRYLPNAIIVHGYCC